MNAIVAVGSDYGIGRDNDLIFNIPEDKKFFRSMTAGKTVVMGRKTLESMPGGKPLPKRRNIVLSRDASYAPEGVESVHSFEELFELIKDIPSDEVFLIGGAEIYNALLDKCDKAYVTHVRDSRPADKFFPNIEKMPQWSMEYTSEEKEYEGTKFVFCTYVRK